MFRVILWTMLACITPFASGCVHPKEKITKDVKYGEKPRNTLDLYLPENPIGAPVVVFVHGGRWYRNDKSQIKLYDRIEALNNAGFAIASINYTYSSEALWPAQLDDTLSAIDFISEQAGAYGYDGDRIGIWGQSSGAHMILMALAADAERANPKVDAAVSWYAPTDLYNIAADRDADNVPGGNERFGEPTPESLLVGAAVPENKTKADKASPVFRFASLSAAVDLPPILLVHGDSDFVISPLQSERLFRTIKSREKSSDIKLRLVSGGKHGGEMFENEVSVVVDFFITHLRE